jgi:hypothetical protein
MDIQALNSEDAVHLEGLPTQYHRLEQCQMGLGWSTYAQDQAHEQQALQQLYADLVDRADAATDIDEHQFAGLPVRFHDSERWQTGEGWREYHAEQATEHAFLLTKYADVDQSDESNYDDA